MRDDLMNILYIYHNADAYGGGDESLLALLNRLNRNRFNPYVLCTSDGLFVDKLKKLNIEYKIINKDYLNQIGRIRLLFLLIRLCLFIKRQKIKLIHINSLGRLHYLILLCKLIGVRSVYHLRSLLVTRTIHRRTRIIINLSDKIIVVSEAIKETAVSVGIKKDKISVIYNGVDLEEFNPYIEDTQFKKELGIDSYTHLVGMIGRIVPWKGCDDFIKAVAKVIKTIPDTKFVIVGESPNHNYLEYLKNLALELNINNHLIFTGLISNMPCVYSALDLLVLPSHIESFSRVVIEAMSVGKPVIGTNVGGTPEQLIDNVTGLLVPPRDPVSLAEAIIKILQDKKIAKEMGIFGRRRAEEIFGLDSHVRKIEGIYEKILFKKGIKSEKGINHRDNRAGWSLLS
jgi:glycosyltransferase involved in cell wall biosynthesis